MLRNVVIMAASGIVLFSKEYANAIAQVHHPASPWLSSSLGTNAALPLVRAEDCCGSCDVCLGQELRWRIRPND